MIDPAHDFQLLSHYHAVLEGIRRDAHSRLVVISGPKKVVQKPGREVGVFPSSFNPVTRGHMAMLQRAVQIKAFEEMLLVLDIRAMDKEIFGATLVDRLVMLRLLQEDHPQFSVAVSNRGLFLSKAEALKEMYPKGTGITFIVGYDTLARVFDPNYYDEPEGSLGRLFGCCTFMVANRGDSGRDTVKQLTASAENRRFRHKIHFFEIPHHLAQISSTQVRQHVRQGKPSARLVPARVRTFMETVRLYQPDTEISPRGQRVNLYDLRTQVFRRLCGRYPEGRGGIDIGKIVDEVVEGMRTGRSLGRLLDTTLDGAPGVKGERSGRASKDGTDN
jgi:nicotinate (nicotinamide) nucleotide adenylyltransferase